MNTIESLKNGLLASNMDTNTQEYQDFKLLIKSKVSSESKNERIEIALFSLKYEMQDYLQSSKKSKPIGVFIKQFILATEITQVHFAKFIGTRPSNLHKILNGERRLNLDLALILEHLSDIKAETWLMIQNRNEIFKMNNSRKVEFEKYKLKKLIK